MVGRVDDKERHKVKMALKYCEAKLTEHSEERRKVSTVGTLVLVSMHVL